MLSKDSLGQAEVVTGPKPTDESRVLLANITMRAWRVARVFDWRKWTGKSEDPIKKLIEEAFELGRREERGAIREAF